MKFKLSTLLFLYAFATASSGAAELRAGKATVIVEKEGSGFIDAVGFNDRKVVIARAGRNGAEVALARASSSSIFALFARKITSRLKPVIRTISEENGRLAVEGSYSDGRITVPFTRLISPVAGKDAVTIREEVDFARVPRGWLVAMHELFLPLVICKDEHLRMLGLGGSARAELFRMDMNDEPRRNQNISDNRAFQPYWEIGGVIQYHNSYSLWRANHADTLAYTVEAGLGGPGWADYSELDWGITVEVARPLESAPWAITIDARKGLITVGAVPATMVPMAGEELGKRTLEWKVVLHESSWPAAWPCELSFDGYRRLLDYLNQGSRYTHLNYVCSRIGVQIGDGKKSQEQMDEICTRIMFKERIQPSVLLRLLYRGDAWRMSGLVCGILGKAVPRNQALKRWDALAKELLTKFEHGDVP